MTTPSLADRDIRQRQIVPPEKLAACHAIVVGVGAIGRQVALQLAAVGISSMDLIDHDTVEVANLALQAYWPQDLGQPKVLATADICRRINPAIELATFPERFRRSMPRQMSRPHDPAVRAVVFCCVDSITARQMVWESVKGIAHVFIDARMAAEVIRVLAVEHPATDSYYATTLFAEERAYAGSCTAKSTVYTASIAAGLMIGQFTKWLRELPVDRDLSLNLLAAELAVA